MDKHSFNIVTAFDKNYSCIGEVCREFIEGYAKNCKFPYEITQSIYSDIDEEYSENRPPSWAKIKIISHEIKNQLAMNATPLNKWVMWVDADSLILDHEMDLRRFADSNFDIIFCKDENGLNAGIGLYKVCQFTLAFLDKVWKRDNDIHHGWWEQKAIHDILKESPLDSSRVKLIETHPLNVKASDFKSGDYILHIAGGVRTEYKHRILKEFKEKYKYLLK